jgi:hypothetical protein
VPGIHAPAVDDAIAMAGRGFRFIGVATDADPHAAQVPASVRRGSGGP